MPGKVYLVGSGPGDPGLLTLKGKRCLEEADIVIHDYLANPRLLDYARPEAERLLVGKHGGGVSVEQDTINQLIIDRARRGQTVVRLKGGDPFMFGRGGEEAQVIRGAGLEFEIVPGVSAGTAAPAYAGIPLTHRDLASNVIFTTGYEYPTKQEPAVHWNELARSGSTLVLFMTTRQLSANMAKLVAGGLSGDTPVALIRWGTRARQHTLVATVNTIAARAAAENIQPPAIAVVGEVVRLREQLNWFERKPLFGRRIIITRARSQAATFAEQLETYGAEVIACPLIETAPPPSLAPLDDALRRAHDFDWVVFTSATGVHVFFDRIQGLGGDIRGWHRAQFAAIGPQTAKALRAFCVRVNIIPDEFRAEAVVAALAAAGVRGKRILLPRAANARAILPQQLRDSGAIVEEVVSYVSLLPATSVTEFREVLLQGDADLVTFTSSSTVHNFAAVMRDRMEPVLARILVGCIGPVTAETARSYGMRVAIEPKSYTVAAFADAIVRYYTGLSASPYAK